MGAVTVAEESYAPNGAHFLSAHQDASRVARIGALSPVDSKHSPRSPPAGFGGLPAVHDALARGCREACVRRPHRAALDSQVGASPLPLM